MSRIDYATLIESAHDDMASMASALLRRNQRSLLLQTQDLVGEAVLRLLNSEDVTVEDRSHFMALTARTMRRVLVDAARARATAKREGQQVTIMTGDGNGEPGVDLLALDHALRRMSAIDPERAQLIELRYFAGLTLEETAEVLGVSTSSVQRRWLTARLWLRDAIATELQFNDAVS